MVIFYTILTLLAVYILRKILNLVFTNMELMEVKESVYGLIKSLQIVIKIPVATIYIIGLGIKYVSKGLKSKFTHLIIWI